jgi:hypothetical protein
MFDRSPYHAAYERGEPLADWHHRQQG